MNTPTSWKAALTPTGKLKIVDRNGFSIANLTSNVKKENESNAELIVRAVNYHDRLVELVQKLSDELGYSLSNSASVMGVKFTPTDNSLINTAQQLLTELNKESNAND